MWPVRPSQRQAEIATYLHATLMPVELPLPGKDYNVAPTTFQPIIPAKQGIGRTRADPGSLGVGAVLYRSKATRPVVAYDG